MAEPRQLPGSARQNNERVQGRPYDSSFARFPRDEVDPIDTPGGGPRGGISEGETNVPLVVIVIGIVVAFTAFGFQSPWPLLTGVTLIVVGTVWSRVRFHTGGKGSGTVRARAKR